MDSNQLLHLYGIRSSNRPKPTLKSEKICRDFLLGFELMERRYILIQKNAIMHRWIVEKWPKVPMWEKHQFSQPNRKVRKGQWRKVKIWKVFFSDFLFLLWCIILSNRRISLSSSTSIMFFTNIQLGTQETTTKF